MTLECLSHHLERLHPIRLCLHPRLHQTVAQVRLTAPTVLFVLQRAIEAGLPQRTLLLALGPGFTSSGLSLARR